MKSKTLSAIVIERLTRVGMHRDSKGLYLKVGPSGGKSWVFRFQLAGRARNAGLGPYPEISLAKARELATEWRAKLKQVNPVDPLEEHHRSLAAMRDAGKQTFGLAAQAWLEKERGGWSAKYASEVSKMVALRCCPIWDRPVRDIDTGAVQAVLDPFWREHRVAASRLRMYIEAVLDFAAVAKKWRPSGDNPARWSGHLEHVYRGPSMRDVEHLASLPFADVPAFVAELRQRSDVASRALELVTLTATRTQEVLGARWDEIDISGKLWTIPAERMKAGKEHRVPLSPRACELLASIPRGTDGRVFPELASNAMRSVMGKLRPDFTVHGLRSAFKDFAHERAHAPEMIVELCLAHAVGDAVARAYGRSDLVARRARLMDEWCAYLSQQATSADVIQLRHG